MWMWKAIDKIGLFLGNVFTALKFAAFDYDVTLRRTKPPKQRIIIWVTVFTVIFGGTFLLLFLFGYLARSYVSNRLNK